MTTLKDILRKNILDYKKAELLRSILLQHGFKCLVEVDSRYIKIENLEIDNPLTKEKLYGILELKNIEKAKLRTELGIYEVFYIPTPY